MAVELGAMKPSMLMFNLFPPGWIFIDDEQLQYLSGVMKSSLKSTVKEQSVMSTSVPSNKVEMDEDAAIKESKISQIKDLFPDYVKGS